MADSDRGAAITVALLPWMNRSDWKNMVVNWKKALELAANPGPRLVAGVQVLLVLALAYSLAQISWRFIPAADEIGRGMASASPSAMSAPMRRESSGAGQIPQWHLFGEASVETPAAVPEELPETNLQLTLRGVIASPDDSQARAIVADSGGKENFYKVGDPLPGNATLKEIYGDRIVIQRAGRYETLTLPKDALAMGADNSVPALPAASRGKKSYTLREYRNALMHNPGEVADLVRIMPKSEGGRFVGYQLQPGRDPQFMARYGLMPGDVVVAVNGVVLDNPAKGMQAMRDLTRADTLDLEIDRNGVRQRFTLPIK